MANKLLHNAAKHVVHTDITKLRDDVHFTQLLVVQDQRLRVDIRSNAYKEQSYSRVDYWNGTKWTEVWTLAGEVQSTSHGLTYKQNWNDLHHFMMDRNKLFVIACEVLNVDGSEQR